MDFFSKDVPVELQRLGGEVVQEVRVLNAPKGTLSEEPNVAYSVTSAARAAASPDPAPTDWPDNNRALNGDR